MDFIDTAVRIITDGGELVSYTEYDDCDRAWTAFIDATTQLRDGEIAQLIEDDLIRPAGRGFVEYSLPYLDEALRHEEREGVGADVEPDRGVRRSHRGRRA